MTREALVRPATRPATLARALTFALGLGVLCPATTALAADESAAPIRRALGFLLKRQVEAPHFVIIGDEWVRDYPGDWPQFFSLQGLPALRVRDVSPFMVAFIHHALTQVVEENRRSLGLSRRDVRAARRMRKRAIEFLSRFESPAEAPDAGTFGFWPYDQYPDVPRPAVERALFAWLRGPILGGARVPLNLHVYPNPLAIPSDADVTATTYAALLDDAALDGGPSIEVPFHQFFFDWRDLGVVPRRRNPPWLAPASGAFLTWLTYLDPSLPLFPNDVDLVVNANVLFALGRNDRLDLAGVAEAVALINEATALGLHRDRIEEIAEYYPDNLVFHYAVSRAFHEGGVTALAPAVEILADDLEASAIERADGAVFWDHGAPQLNTAFAMLTLLNAGRDSPLVARAAAYLTAEQSSTGGFGAAPFFVARADGGQVFEFSSAAFTTAMALEALARHALGRHERRTAPVTAAW
jgi:hypothetical protein